MTRLLFFLVATLCATLLSAQWSASALVLGGGASVHAIPGPNVDKGTVAGVGAELAYGFGGWIDHVSLRLQYERYRSFNLSESYSLYGGENYETRNFEVFTDIRGWNSWQLTAGAEGAFILLKRDSRLRMHVRFGILRTGAVDVYHYALQLSGTGYSPSTQNVFDSLDQDPARNALERYRPTSNYGISYRMTPGLTVSLSMEQIYGNLSAPYTISVNRFGYDEDLKITRFGKLGSLRVAVAARLFGAR